MEPGTGAHDLDIDEMFRIACGRWNIAPGEFWAMCPHEWWLLFDVHVGDRLKDYEDTTARLHKLFDKVVKK